MKQEFQHRLQAYVDGELPANERAALEQDLAQDAQAKDLVAELRATKASLADYEASIRVPETREFYWSQLKRRIEAADKRIPAGVREGNWFAAWRRYLMPLGTAAVLLVIGLFASMQTGFFETPGIAIGESESAVTDPGALTYQDFSTRTTLVWLTFPSEN